MTRINQLIRFRTAADTASADRWPTDRLSAGEAMLLMGALATLLASMATFAYV